METRKKGMMGTIGIMATAMASVAQTSNEVTTHAYHAPNYKDLQVIEGNNRSSSKMISNQRQKRKLARQNPKMRKKLGLKRM
jgi:hypothetical protein